MNKPKFRQISFPIKAFLKLKPILCRNKNFSNDFNNGGLVHGNSITFLIRAIELIINSKNP